MCEPATLALIGAGVAAAGTAVSGVMTYNQQKYQQKVAKANQAAENARIAGAIDQSQEERQALARKYAATMGAQRASMAANGIDVDFGSAADLQADTQNFYEEDQARLNRNNVNVLKGIDMSAANYGSQAKAAGMAATGTAISTAFDVGTTILGGLKESGRLRQQRAGAA